MARFVSILDLVDDPALISEYTHWHQHVWPEVLEHLRSIGFLTCEIYLAGNRLVMVVESESPIASDGGGNPVPKKVAEWEALMDQYQMRLPFASDGSKWVLADKIFELEP